MASSRDIVGLIPAAGVARRLGMPSSSKELIEVRDRSGERKPVIHFLLENMREAAVDEVVVVVAPGKDDIAESLGVGREFGLDLSYMSRVQPWGVPFTLDSAYDAVGQRTVAFGFPDIMLAPKDSLRRVVRSLEGSSADVILGLFPVEQPSKWDAVVRDETGEIGDILPKPHRESTGLTWILAVWKPSFTDFIHRFVKQFDETKPRDPNSHLDLSLGVVMRKALNAGMTFEGVFIEDGWCHDIGTPDDLAKVR